MRPLRLLMQAFGPFAGVQEIDFTQFSEGPILIAGDTGSGKTMIFDAISYALFNETSVGSREASELRSDFADEGLETKVELSFLLGSEEQYKIMRRPKQLRKKARGSGLSSSSAEVEFYLPDGTVLTKQKEVKEKLTELLGLDASQFKQTALLAQGEFSKLLSATSAEREEIFRSIFRTERASGLQVYLAEARSTAETDFETALNSAYLLLNRLPEDFRHSQARLLDSSAERGTVEFSELLKSFQKYLERLKKSAAESADNLQKAQAEAENLRQIEKFLNAEVKLLKDLKLLQQEYEKWQKADSESTELRSRLAFEALYLEIRPKFERVNELRQEALDLAAEERSIEAARKALEESSAELIKELSLRAEDESKLNENKAELSRLELQLEKLKALNLAKAKAESIKSQLRDREQAIKDLKATELELQERLQRMAGLVELKLKLTAEQSEKVSASNKHQQIESKLSALEKLALDLRFALAEEQSAERAVAALELTAEQAKSAFSEAAKAYNSEQAGRLAKELKAGLACPVCGSLEHPSPAGLNPQAISQTKLDELQLEAGTLAEKLAGAKARYSELESRLERSSKDYQLAVEELKVEFDRLFPDNLRHSFYRDDFATVPATIKFLPTEPEKSDDVFEALCQSLSGLTEAVRKLKAAESRDLHEIELALEACATELGDKAKLEARSQKLGEELQELSAEFNQKQLEKAAIEAQIQELAQGLEIKTEAEAGAKISATKLSLTQLKQQLEQLAEREKAELQAKSEIAERKRGKAVQIERNQEQLLSLEKAVQDFCQQHGLELEDLVQRAKLTVDRAAMQKELDQHQQQGHSLNERIKALEKSLEEAKKEHASSLKSLGLEAELSPSQALDFCQEKLKATNKQVNEESQSQAFIKHDLGLCAAVESDLLKFKVKLQALEQSYLEIEHLNRAAQGALKDGIKRSFESYLQAYYFDLVLKLAGQRFLELSDGRYELRNRSQVDDGRRRTGLDINVYDRYSNTERAVGTLSGGESFKAALAFALALSDQAQAASARRRIDCLFVDEGFGTLDSNSLEAALDCLLALEDEHRLVAVISHVKLLAESIDSQIRVHKDSVGSYIECKGPAKG
ncbi:MAG: SMC family ATPase [Eubacteriales bacterium]|nr:SMC family ATPase [Eubacteriales bacterium]